MYHHVSGPDALTEHLHSGVQGIDPLLTGVLDSVLPGKAALSLLLELLIEAGLSSLQLTRKLLKYSDPSQ